MKLIEINYRLGLIIMFGLGVVLGMLVCKIAWEDKGLCIVQNDTEEKAFDGLWLKGYSWEEAINKAYRLDQNGEWVCSNIKGFTFKRCVEIASHECGHELFAELCEKNQTKCMELGA